MKKISLQTFLYHFSNNHRKDKKYCFILGAGASKQSGIPTGAELVKEWMNQLTEMLPKDILNQWKSEKKILDDNLAEHYSEIYDKRFELDKKEGYAFLEQLMEGIDPSCGYSVLAQILATTNHKIVITTNFDSLTEDALFIYTRKKPLVIGHEALANYISPFVTRPIIVKIHRDLFLSPKNTTEETGELEIRFKKNLENVFEHYTPIVIGYGGNDGSLMGFLGDLEEIEGGIFWCYRETGSGLSTEIEDLIKKFNGCCVPISGFDELMMQIGNKLELGLLDTKIKEIAEQRANTYIEQVKKAIGEESSDPTTKEAISDIVSRGEKDWLYYELLVSKEKDLNKREEIYRTGLKKLPVSSQLHASFAVFLHEEKKEYDQAEYYYDKAYHLNKNNYINLGNYANFLYKINKEYDRAEKYYQQTIELNPYYEIHIGNYALFLHEIRKEYNKAEEYYKKAIELNPRLGLIQSNYALFLQDIRKDYDKAEEYYKKAIELSLAYPNSNANYSKLLIEIREFDSAKEYIDKSFDLNKGQRKDIELELWFYRYAVFFTEYKDAPKKIEELLNQGIKSPGWNLKNILAIAKEMKHPNFKKLCEYADLITKED